LFRLRPIQLYRSLDIACLIQW